MKRYLILEESNSAKLETAIETYLRNGWKLVGGLTIYVAGGTRYYAQAITGEE